MLTATCHCGAVEVTVPGKPDWLGDCDCSICRRYGVLWAYYPNDRVEVDAPEVATHEYIWGRKALAFVRCRTCGCVMYWQRIAAVAGGKMGINARNFDPSAIAGVEIRHLDGSF